MCGAARRWALFFALSAGAITLAVDVGAQPTDKDVCAAAYDQSQQLRDIGRLRLARAQLVVCQAACPATLTPDCDRWKVEVEAMIPSVQLVARDVEGRLLTDVRVFADGKLVASRVDLLPVEIDPGSRVFVFEREGGGRVELLQDVKPSVRGQRVVVKFEETALAGPAPAHATSADQPATPARPGAIDPPLGAILLAGGGGLALVLGGALALKGHLDRGDLHDCKPRCPQADLDAISTTWTVAAVSAGLGAVAVGGAAAWWLMDRQRRAGDPPGVSASWNVGPTGGRLVVRTTF